MTNKIGNGKISVVMCFLLCFVCMTKIAAQDTVNNAKELDEVDKLLQKLNKPAVKSIKVYSSYSSRLQL